MKQELRRDLRVRLRVFTDGFQMDYDGGTYHASDVYSTCA